jgi:hypothetical protein
LYEGRQTASFKREAAAYGSRPHVRNCAQGRDDVRHFDPTGKSLNTVKPLMKKYSDLQKFKISCISIPSCPVRGALAIVTDVGQDAVDAEGAEDGRHPKRTVKSCGPDASAVGVKLVE